MATLRLRLLGQPLVCRDERPVRFMTRKALAAVAYLAAEGGLQSREQLAALLWPDHDLADARKNLRTGLTYMQQALGDGALVDTHDAVGLDPSSPLTLDLDLQTLARVHRLVRASDGAVVPALREELERAVALCRGPFLDALDIPDAPEFEAWLAGQRARWAGLAGELLERLVGLQAAAGDLGPARGTLERWVALEPGEERAWEQLLILALQAGDLVAARRGWAACRAALAELGVAPGEPLQTLSQQIAAAHVAQPWPPAPAGQEGAGRLGPAPLVGRAGPLAALRRAFARARAGQAQLMVLHGEAGIGKTRLAAEFLAWARAQGAEALAARAFAAEGSLPYAPLVAALRPRLERENAPEDLLGDLWLAELARLLPELRERYPDLPPAPDDATLGPGRLFEAVTRLGQALAARRPLVLFLDDMQWADAGTRDLVRYALRRWSERGVRAAVLLAARVDGLGPQRAIEQWLVGLGCEAPTTRLELERLTTEEVAHLVGALAGEASAGEQAGAHDADVASFGRWLAGKTGGHPLFVMELLQALLDEGLLRLRSGVGDDWALDIGSALGATCLDGRADLLPAGLRALTMALVARLDETAAAVLAAAAVLEGSFSAEEVLRVAAVDAREGERALDQLVRGRLLREVPGTGEYRVGDELLREVLHAGLGATRRRRLAMRALAVRGTVAEAASGAPATTVAERGDPAGGPGLQPPAMVGVRAGGGRWVHGGDRREARVEPVFDLRNLLAHGSGLAHGPAGPVRPFLAQCALPKARPSPAPCRTTADDSRRATTVEAGANPGRRLSRATRGLPAGVGPGRARRRARRQPRPKCA